MSRDLMYSTGEADMRLDGKDANGVMRRWTCTIAVVCMIMEDGMRGLWVTHGEKKLLARSWVTLGTEAPSS